MTKESTKKNESVGSLEVVNDFENKLQQAVNGEPKKIPKWQVDAISKMKDKHIGSLQSQIRYLRENKKKEFMDLYVEDIKKIYRDSQILCGSIRTEFQESLSILKSKIIEKIKIEFASSEEFYNLLSKYGSDIEKNNISIEEKVYLTNPETLELKDISFLRRLELSEFVRINYILSEYDMMNIVKKYFTLNYDDFFDNAKQQISRLEKLFEESLSFNDLITTHAVYQELKKADSILDKVSKIKIEKIEIDFVKFMQDGNEIKRLDKRIDARNKYEFVQNK